MEETNNNDNFKLDSHYPNQKDNSKPILNFKSQNLYYLKRNPTVSNIFSPEKEKNDIHQQRPVCLTDRSIKKINH